MNRNELITEITSRILYKSTNNKKNEHDQIIEKIVDSYKESDKRKVGKTLITQIIHMYEKLKQPTIDDKIVKELIVDVIDMYEQVICDAISSNDEVVLHGFLKIERRKRKGHKGNDLKNNGLIDIPDSETVKVTPGSKLKECIKEQ